MGFKYKKSLGQNFLKDNNVVQKIVDSAKITKDDLVIEIGPGAGIMSNLIIPLSRFTILYEIDKRLDNVLNDRLSSYSNYEIVFNDFLKENVRDRVSNYDYKNLYVVANLPYYITTPIVEKFIDDDILPDKMVLMVQKEVALRYSAKPNTRNYGALTVLLNYYYNIKKLFDVSRKSFVPEPNVDSAVICLTKKRDRLVVKDMNFFKRLVRDSFRYKRKNLKNNLKGYDLDIVSNVLNKYKLELDVRAEALSLDIFVEIANELV